MFKDATTWAAPRIHQLQALKDIAFKVVDFISQFEDELVRIWNKPKFVRGSFYVVTLDRLAARPGGLNLVADILEHPGLKIRSKSGATSASSQQISIPRTSWRGAAKTANWSTGGNRSLSTPATSNPSNSPCWLCSII